MQEEQIAVYQAQLESAKLDLARTRMTLPFDARIATVNVEAKQFVQTGGTLATADSLDVAEVEAQIPISQFRSMIRAGTPENLPDGMTAQSLSRIVETLGLEATVRLRVGDETIVWPARFARISDTVDPKTRTVGAIVAVDGAYAKAVPGKRPPLSKGMFVEIELRTRAMKNRIVVPRSALHDGKLYVVNAERRLEIRAVTTDLKQGDFAVVADGISSGDTVVVSDLVPAVDGMLLTPENDDDLSTRLKAEAAGEMPAK